LWLSSAFAVRADTAIPFQFDPITSADAARPVTVSMYGQVAAVIERGFPRSGGGLTNNLRTYFRTNSTDWVEVGMLPAPGTARSIDVDNCRLAVGLRGSVKIWSISCGDSKPTWSLNQTIVFTNAGYTAISVDLDGTRLAVLIGETSDFLGSGGQSVNIYDEIGTNWVHRAKIGVVVTSELFGASLTATAMDLEGSYIALSAANRNVIQIHEKDQGGINSWGQAASISNQPPGYTMLGLSIAFDGARLAASASDAVTQRPVILTYSNNMGGVGNWGFAGTLLNQPEGIGYLTLDTDSGRLAVLGLPALTTVFASGQPSRVWLYQGGAGPAGWLLERTRTTGLFNWTFFDIIFNSSGSLAPSLSGTRLMLGVGDTNTFQDITGWAAAVHSKDQDDISAWGTEFVIETKGPPDQFGFSVDVDGNFMVTGMPNDDWAGTNSGSAYVWYLFDSGTTRAWFPVARLVDENAAPSHLFGYDVSINQIDEYEARVAVGAWGESSGRGAAYIFDVDVFRGQVKPHIRIAPLPSEEGASFGFAVSLDDDRLAVGAPLSGIAGANWGAVYLFEKNLGGTDKWGCLKTNAAPSGSFLFGSKVVLAGNAMAATKPSGGGIGRSVFVYKKDTGGLNNWGLANAITAPSGSPNEFAASVDLINNGGTIIIGATHSSMATNGKVYLYVVPVASTNYQVLLTIDDPADDGPSFGSSVNWIMFGGLFVGAKNSGISSSGVARLFGFSSTGGVTNVILMASLEGSPGDNLGSDVSGSLLYAVAAAPQNDANGPGAGRVHAMRVGSYELWAGSQPAAFGTAWKPWEDYDGDLDDNLMEFAMGTDPMNAASKSRLFMYLRFTPPVKMAWDRPNLPYSTLALDYNMQLSGNLGGWNTAAFTSTTSTTRLFDTIEPKQHYRLAPRYPVFAPFGDGEIIILD